MKNSTVVQRQPFIIIIIIIITAFNKSKVHCDAADLINRKECKKIKIRRKSKAKADAAELHHFTSSPVFYSPSTPSKPFRKPYPRSRDYSYRVASTASLGRGLASISTDSSTVVQGQPFSLFLSLLQPLTYQVHSAATTKIILTITEIRKRSKEQ